MMLRWFLNMLMALFSSILTGVLIRINPGRVPTSDDLQKFIDVLLSNDIAHRGGSFDAPENTMCAFNKALEHGYKVIEIDIQYTADGIPVVIHDETLDRTTNGNGMISEKTIKELKMLTANSNFSDINDCKIPTLDETIEFAIANDIILLFDVKGGIFCSKITNTLTQIKEKYPQFQNKFAVISFFPDVLHRVRKDHPTVFTGFTRRHDHIQNEALKAGYHSPSLHQFFFVSDKIFDFLMFYIFVPWMKINMLEIRKDDVSESYVRDVAPRPVLTWTVNDPVEKKFFKRIGCSVMTDIVSDGVSNVPN
ncbi:hypothetical protein ACHWQZ_G009490 [Mnemiopsis leidyi]